MGPESAPADRPERPLSPCTKICALNAWGYCAGCFRTGEEIGQWTSMSPAEQWRLIAQLEERRLAFASMTRGNQ